MVRKEKAAVGVGEELYKKYRPRKLSELSGQHALVTELQSLGKRNAIPHAILLSGPSGCLHGDTEIYDPVDGSNHTIRYRWMVGDPFHVVSLSADMRAVVSVALPPVRYSSGRMFRVCTERSSFFATSEHRIRSYIGEYLSLKDIFDQGFSSFRLLSTWGTCPVDRQLDDRRCSQIAVDSLADYHYVDRFYDAQPLYGLGIVQVLSPSRVGVPVHSRLSQMDDPGIGFLHSHLSQMYVHQPMPGYQILAGKHIDHEILFQSVSEIRELPYGLHPIRHLPDPLLDQIDRDERLPCLVQELDKASSSDGTPELGSVVCGYESVLSIEDVGEDEYFDFHVPFYNNYWCKGIFHHNCGKTTVARILQSKLKCAEVDFIEMNCADTRGIDDIRDIQKRMWLAPIGGPCRIFYLDEVHQLVGPAQQSFLKALEDTPSHVYFIMSTTDPGKLITAIKTRCTHFKAAALSDKHMIEAIRRVTDLENVDVSDEVVDQIVELSDGSARKALVLLHGIIGLETEQEMLECLVGNKNDIEAFSCTLVEALLAQKKSSWAAVAKMLKAMPDEPEKLRMGIVSYAGAIILNGDAKAARAYLVIRAFSDPLYSSSQGVNQALLRASCWEVMTTSK